MTKFMFSENEEIYKKNRARNRLHNNTNLNKVPTGTFTGKAGGKIRVLHTHCKNPNCGVELKGKIWQHLGVCALCDMS